MIDAVKDKLGEIIGFSNADQTEALIMIVDSSLTRFANNIIHQNTTRKEITIYIRVAIGKKVGIANINRSDLSSLRTAVNKAIEIAKAVPERDFYGLPKGGPSQYEINRFDKKTADYSAEEKAKKIKEIVSKAGNLNASGAVENGVQILGVANSCGINKTQVLSSASFNLVVSGQTGSGYGSSISSDIDKLEIKKITDKAVDKARSSQSPVEIKPGRYAVLLEPYAVAEMLALLSFSGMGALAFEEGRSFLSGNINKKIMADLISIYDDASDNRSFGFGFDFEGVTRQKVDIIKEGVAREPVYDSQTAARASRSSTGHALPASAKHGPLPFNLILKEGESTPEAMLKNIDRGIYITRFHYTNLEHPLKTIFTGMTRDGTYLIEKGRITKPIKNMRFTQSIVGALANVTAVGNDSRLVESMIGAYLVPSLAIEGFNFTSATEF